MVKVGDRIGDACRCWNNMFYKHPALGATRPTLDVQSPTLTQQQREHYVQKSYRPCSGEGTGQAGEGFFNERSARITVRNGGGVHGS